MSSSRIDCQNIHKPNCEFYDENRLCPPDCKGFVPKVPIPVPKEEVPVEETIEQIDSENEEVFDVKPKRTYTKRN